MECLQTALERHPYLIEITLIGVDYWAHYCTWFFFVYLCLFVCPSIHPSIPFNQGTLRTVSIKWTKHISMCSVSQLCQGVTRHSFCLVFFLFSNVTLAGYSVHSNSSCWGELTLLGSYQVYDTTFPNANQVEPKKPKNPTTLKPNVGFDEGLNR